MAVSFFGSRKIERVSVPLENGKKVEINLSANKLGNLFEADLEKATALRGPIERFTNWLKGCCGGSDLKKALRVLHTEIHKNSNQAPGSFQAVFTGLQRIHSFIPTQEGQQKFLKDLLFVKTQGKDNSSQCSFVFSESAYRIPVNGFDQNVLDTFAIKEELYITTEIDGTEPTVIVPAAEDSVGSRTPSPILHDEDGVHEADVPVKESVSYSFQTLSQDVVDIVAVMTDKLKNVKNPADMTRALKDMFCALPNREAKVKLLEILDKTTPPESEDGSKKLEFECKFHNYKKVLLSFDSEDNFMGCAKAKDRFMDFAPKLIDHFPAGDNNNPLDDPKSTALLLSLDAFDATELGEVEGKFTDKWMKVKKQYEDLGMKLHPTDLGLAAKFAADFTKVSGQPDFAKTSQADRLDKIYKTGKAFFIQDENGWQERPDVAALTDWEKVQCYQLQQFVSELTIQSAPILYKNGLAQATDNSQQLTDRYILACYCFLMAQPSLTKHNDEVADSFGIKPDAQTRLTPQLFAKLAHIIIPNDALAIGRIFGAAERN